jgi:hypothetical protein
MSETHRTVAMTFPTVESTPHPEDLSLEHRDAFLESPGDGQLINNRLNNATELLTQMDLAGPASPEELWSMYGRKLGAYAKRYGEDGFERPVKDVRRKVATAVLRLDNLSYQLAERKDLRTGKPVQIKIGTEGGKKEGQIHDGTIMTIAPNGRILVAIPPREGNNPDIRPVTFEELAKLNPDPNIETYYETYTPNK